ncbi:hypothetical protein [Nocardia sp. NBC_01388]|uniref:hypothetical protein n=1 Tax=Nocardia sp. NBC_01388 TaxID=2903596 RepID=UPI003251CC97
MAEHTGRRAGSVGRPAHNHHRHGVLYPRSALELVRVLVAVAVIVSWAGLAWRSRRRQARA